MYCCLWLFGKALTVLSLTTGGISIASLATFIGAPEGVASLSFSFSFSVTKGIIKKVLKTTHNKKKKHNKLIRFSC